MKEAAALLEKALPTLTSLFLAISCQTPAECLNGTPDLTPRQAKN